MLGVAGGQRVRPEDVAAGLAPPGTEGHQTIAVVSRTLRWVGGRWVDQPSHRPLVGVLDADGMAARWPLRAGSG